ncbi:MAG TPA: XRE family transcriptional regulator, partial [Chloroflexota bacterium]|nr:XRE family transcriptional regulator [Chloroflexota bacterium]
MALGQEAADRAAESFAGLLLRHRGRTGLTQRQLADRIGASARTVENWEGGVNYPSAKPLQALIAALLESRGLTVGREIEEARELWATVLQDAPRMHTPLDEVWLAAVLAEHHAPQAPEQARDVIPAQPALSAADSSDVERRQDWGEAPDDIGFVGRAEELATLRDWVLEEHCRLAAVLGMGGIGKTVFASQLAQDLAPRFHRVYWRSLRDALPVGEWMAGAIGFLSAHHLVPPEGEAARLAVLLELLRDRPSLLVLDNFETVLEPGQREGRYRDGFAGYGAVLQGIGETRHQSCLVVTSREAPPELAVLRGGVARRFQLVGLGVPEGQVLLADKQLSGTDDDWANLIARFGGNGLALKVVGESISQVFAGDIGMFLEQSGSATVFGGIRRLLAEQIERSSALEQEVLRVLAVEREPVTVAELIAALGPRLGRGTVLEAVEALRRRSVVERAETAGRAAFTLQSVVLEYVTDRFVEKVADEIARGQPALLVDQPLIKAQAKDYVRQTQEHLIGEPILQRLNADSGHRGAERWLLALLDRWRNRPEADQGYGPGNVVNLLRLGHGNLRGVDLSHLALRQAYLAGVETQDASLAGSHVSEVVLAEAFNFPICVALSSDGASLVTGTAAGEVWVWRVADRTPLLALQGHTGQVHGLALNEDGRLLASG